MILAIHQPNYFPWLGYLDKMAKVDEYIVLDEVQLTDRSGMMRNQFLENNLSSHILSLSLKKKGYREKKTNEIELSDFKEVQRKHKIFFQMNYGKSKGFSEVWPYISDIFEKDYTHLIDIDMDTMIAMRKLYNINSKLILQSQLDYDKTAKKNDLMLTLCKAVSASVYLSGQGAKAYMRDDTFETEGIKVIYQTFQHPVYEQPSAPEFVTGLSSIDMMMQLGITNARNVFWSNVEKGKSTDIYTL
ncbi:MAG: WbqC family protein [Lachnospira sp.]|nr:WbqC family protein [Lachnospira sp.]